MFIDNDVVEILLANTSEISYIVITTNTSASIRMTGHRIVVVILLNILYATFNINIIT